MKRIPHDPHHIPGYGWKGLMPMSTPEAPLKIWICPPRPDGANEFYHKEKTGGFSIPYILATGEAIKAPAPSPNRFGVDTDYFRTELAPLMESLPNRPHAELAQYLRTLANAADAPQASPGTAPAPIPPRITQEDFDSLEESRKQMQAAYDSVSDLLDPEPTQAEGELLTVPGPADPDVERVWKEFWLPIVAPNGVIDMEQVKKELFDLHAAIENVPQVYSHITGGALSKINYLASTVIAAADDHWNESLEEERKEWEEENAEPAPVPEVSPAPTTPKICNWERSDANDPDDDCWDTDCGQAFVMNDGTPQENDLKFCCFCGGSIPTPTDLVNGGKETNRG